MTGIWLRYRDNSGIFVCKLSSCLKYNTMLRDRAKEYITTIFDVDDVDDDDDEDDKKSRAKRRNSK